METMLIKLRNEKAAKLLHELEEFNIINVPKKYSAERKLPEKYCCALPGHIADYIQNYVSESRNEWSN